jgi:hypothetical protein
VAEDVAKVNPDLVMRDEDGKPYTVRYEAVNAMLLNEFLKEQRRFLKNSGRCENWKQTPHDSKSELNRLLLVFRK